MGKYTLLDPERNTVLELELTDAQFAELKRFLKELKTPAEEADYKAVLEKYNAVCKNLPPATRLTEKRKRAISRLLKDGYDLDELFRKAAQSRFLGGDNKQKWHASLDWLLIPSNALKVIEGNYSPISTAPHTPAGNSSGTAVHGKCASFDTDRLKAQIMNKYINNNKRK